MATNVHKAHAWGFNAILGSTVTGLFLILSIVATIFGLTNAWIVVVTTFCFAGFVGSIFLSETVRDFLNAHSLRARFSSHRPHAE